MAELPNHAFTEAVKLSKSQSGALASWILAELADEQRWDASFAASQEALARMADVALAEHCAGSTHPLQSP